MIFCCYHGNHFRAKPLHLKTEKLFYVEMLLCCYCREKYLSKLKQHGLHDPYTKEFSFQCLSVMIYKQFIVSIVELIMLSWQPISVHNFQTCKSLGFSITSSSYKVKKKWLRKYLNFKYFEIVTFDVIFGETSLILPKVSENF